MANAYFPAPVENLIDWFARLPGVGRKTAQRLAFYVVSMGEEDAKSFASAISAAKANECNRGEFFRNWRLEGCCFSKNFR